MYDLAFLLEWLISVLVIRLSFKSNWLFQAYLQDQAHEVYFIESIPLQDCTIHWARERDDSNRH